MEHKVHQFKVSVFMIAVAIAYVICIYFKVLQESGIAISELSVSDFILTFTLPTILFVYGVIMMWDSVMTVNFPESSPYSSSKFPWL